MLANHWSTKVCGWKERVSFLEANLRGACWSRMLFKPKNKLLQVMLILLFWLWKWRSKGSVKIFQKGWQDNFLNSEFLVCIFWHMWDGNKVCESGEMVKDVTESNSSGFPVQFQTECNSSGSFAVHLPWCFSLNEHLGLKKLSFWHRNLKTTLHQNKELERFISYVRIFFQVLVSSSVAIVPRLCRCCDSWTEINFATFDWK